MQPQSQQYKQTPEEAIAATKERLTGLSLEIADNESALDIATTKVRALQENRTAMILEYQKTLHALIAMSEIHKANVEIQQEKEKLTAERAQLEDEKILKKEPVALSEISPGSGDHVNLNASGGTDLLAQMPSQINGKKSK